MPPEALAEAARRVPDALHLLPIKPKESLRLAKVIFHTTAGIPTTTILKTEPTEHLLPPKALISSEVEAVVMEMALETVLLVGQVMETVMEMALEMAEVLAKAEFAKTM
jgi:hypothetical protein